jgi:hypothetical protein
MRRSALDWIEEATHLLHQAPVSALALYYIGALPFTLALLWYWLDMSRDAFAYQRVESESFLIAALFVWMKCWQSAFAASLLAELSGAESPAWDRRKIFRMVLQQSAVQPTAFFVLPIAVLITLPLARAVGFYQNATLLGSGDEGSIGGLVRRAKSLTAHWPREAWGMLGIQFGFGCFVFLNVCVMVLFVPQLVKMFLGIESVFTTSVLAMLNTTFFLACALITYLLVDPLLKATYVLRCFYGESLTTGADLRAELRHAN